MSEQESEPLAATAEELVHYDPVTGETMIVENGKWEPQQLLDPDTPALFRDGRDLTERRDS